MKCCKTPGEISPASAGAANQRPRPADMLLGRGDSAERHAQRELFIELRVREEHVAGAVQAIEDALVDVVAAAMAEADKIERRIDDQIEVRVLSHPLGELLRDLHMVANVPLQAVDAIVADDEPELERAEAPAQRNLP